MRSIAGMDFTLGMAQAIAARGHPDSIRNLQFVQLP